MAQPVPFTNPQPFARAAVATVLPQPQADGQNLFVGLDQSSYTVSSGGEIWSGVYVGYGAAGTLTHSAGAFTITYRLCVGYSTAKSGLYNLSGTGALSSPTEIIGYNGTGTVNQNGGTNNTPSLILAYSQGASGTYSLNGGTLQVGSVSTGADGGSVFNFNGGTLQATGSTSSFLQGLTSANVQTGGAIIDSNGNNVTVSQSLLHDTSAGAPASDGGLTKLGTGTLTFTGNNTYNGTSNVNAGTLAYTGASGSLGGGSFILGGGSLLLNTSGTVAASGVSFTNGNSSVTLQAGTLQIAVGGTVSGGGGLIFQGGTLRAGGAFTISSGVPISIQAGGGTVDTSGGNITSGSGFGYSGNAAGVSSGTSPFTIQGGHTLTADFTNNSTWTGPVVVIGSGTTLRNNGGNYAIAGALNVGTGAFYDLNNSGASFGGLSGAGTVLNTGGAGSVKTLTITGAGVNTFSGSIAPAGGATEAANTALTINLNSGGVEIFTGNNTYTGVTTINAGNTLQLGNGGTSGSLGTGAVTDNGALVFNRTDNLTQAGAISGTGSLTQAGTGTLTLTGNNTYTGVTTVSAGTLQAGTATNAFGNNSAVVLANVAGAALNLNNFNQSVGSLAGGGSTGGNVTLGTGTLTVGGNNASTTYAGRLNGTGSLTQAGTGTLTLTGNNTYTGVTTVSAGTLQAGNGGTSGSLGTGAVTDNGALVFNRTDNLTQAGAISGTGSLTQAGTGTLTLTGNNTYTGVTTVSAGTLQAGNGGTSGSLGTGAVTDNGALVFNRTDNLTQAGAISGTGSLTQAGTGTLTLTGNNTYTGVTTLAGGVLNVASVSDYGVASAIGNRAASAEGLSKVGLLFEGGTLQYTGSANQSTNRQIRLANNTTNTIDSSGSGTLSFTYSGTNTDLFESGGTRTLNLKGTNTGGNVFAIGLTDQGSSPTSLTKAGVGTWVLSGNNTYSGATTINAGTLQAGAAPNAFGSNSAVSLANVAGADLDLNNFNQSVGSLAGGGSTGGNVTLGTGTLTVGGSNASTTYAGALVGTGGLTKQGTGTFTLGGNSNVYTGVTTLAGGVLNVGSAGALGSSGTLSFSGGTLQFSSANTSDYSGRFSTASNQAYNLDTNGQNVTLATALTSSGGSLTKLGAGTLTLIGNNTYTGATTINGGTLAVGNGGITGGGSVSVQTGGTLTLRDTSILSISSESVGNSNSSSNTGTFNQTGGTNTVSGSLTVMQGTYNLSGMDGLSASTESVGSNGNVLATFNQSGGTNTVNGTLTVGGSTSSYNLSGAGALSAGSESITNSSTFNQTGGTNTVGGSLTVGGSTTGTYNLSGAGALSAGSESVGSTFNQTGGTNTVSGTLTVGSGSTGTYNLVGGTLQVGSATGGSGNSTGTFNFNGGLLQARASSTSFFQGLTNANVQGGGAIIDTQGYNVTVAQNLVNGTASGSLDGGLIKLGAGTLTLTGTNTFTGPLNINAGIVAVTSESSLGEVANALTVGGGGQLLFTSNATLARTYNLGVSTLGIASGQTLSLAGATVNGGSLTGPGTDVLADGTTLNGTRASSGTVLSQSGGTVAFNNVLMTGNSTFTQAAGAVLNATGDFTANPQTTLTINGTVNAAGGSISGAVTINNGGAINATGGSAAPLYLDGSRSTTINAGGQLNAVSGSTVELGGLLVNNGTQTGTLNVNLGGVARGTGSFGTVNVGQGGYFGANALATSGAVASTTNGLAVIHLTGSGGLAHTAFVGPQIMAMPGTANVTSLTLGSGSVFAFNVQDTQGVAGSGYDLAHASGTLTLSAGTTAGNLITISVASLNSGGMAGQAANFDPTRNYSFVLVQADGGISGYQAGEFVVDTSGFQNATQGGSFSVVQQGNNLDLVFNAAVVPEPSTWALLGVGVVGLGLVTLRRRCHSANA